MPRRRFFSHLCGLGIGTITSALVIVFGACSEEYGEAINGDERPPPSADVVDGGSGDGAATLNDDGAATETEEDDPPPDENGPFPLIDAGCGTAGKEFVEEFENPFATSFFPVINDGGALEQGMTSVTASVTNADHARAYLRRSLCNREGPVSCTVRVAVNELASGNVSLFELYGKAKGKTVLIRVKTNEAQLFVGSTSVEIPRSATSPPLGSDFTEISINVLQSSVVVSPGFGTLTQTADALSGIQFTELRTGVVYLARSDVTKAKARVEVDRVSCKF